MSEICGDNRFEIIDKVKKRLLEATNIEQSPKELEVLDNLLFRLWQCGYFSLNEQNEQLKQQLENEKQLNAEIKKRLVEVEYDCEEFNHEYCDINCKGKRKELVDLYQLISDGLNETLLKQKEDEIKELKEIIKNLRCCENCIDYTKLYETEGCDCENLSNWRMNNEKEN